MPVRQYFSTFDLDFSGDPRTLPILERYQITRRVAEALVEDYADYVVVEFPDDGAPQATVVTDPDTDYGPRFSDIVTKSAATLRPLTSPPVQPAFWRDTSDGKSRFGGSPPAGFKCQKPVFTRVTSFSV